MKIRMVKYFYKKVFNDKVEPELTEIGTAKFHQFGINYEDCGDQIAQYTSAIIELSDGKILNWPADQIQFINNLN